MGNKNGWVFLLDCNSMSLLVLHFVEGHLPTRSAELGIRTAGVVKKNYSTSIRKTCFRFSHLAFPIFPQSLLQVLDIAVICKCQPCPHFQQRHSSKNPKAFFNNGLINPHNTPLFDTCNSRSMICCYFLRI